MAMAWKRKIAAVALGTAALVASACAALAAPQCDAPSVMRSLTQGYADRPSPDGQLKTTLSSISKFREIDYFERPGGRYIDFRFCQAEGIDSIGRPVGFRYVLKGKEWEWLMGYGMSWCATNTTRRMPDGATDFGYDLDKECQGLRPAAYRKLYGEDEKPR
jgi:hypothetical protein